MLEHDPQWDDANDIGDVPGHLRNEIAHFFSIYKDLEPKKSVEVKGLRRPGGSPRGAGGVPGPLSGEPRPDHTNRTENQDREENHAVPREEVQTTVDRYHELRNRIDEGLEPDAFGALADFYTEDAVYIDGAWGRVEGREAIANWLVDSMVGMEDWKFPVEFTAIEGDDVVVKWTQIMPRSKPDGTPYRQSGYSRMIYAGDGRFSYEEDTYNMAHVLEDIEASGWRPTQPMNVPPAHPDRNFDIPTLDGGNCVADAGPPPADPLRRPAGGTGVPEAGEPAAPQGVGGVRLLLLRLRLTPEGRRGGPLAVAHVVGDRDALARLAVLPPPSAGPRPT